MVIVAVAAVAFWQAFITIRLDDELCVIARHTHVIIAGCGR